MIIKSIRFQTGRKVDDPCTVFLELFKIDGDAESSIIPIKIVATRNALNDLTEMAWTDPTGLGRGVAEALSEDKVQNVLQRDTPKRWNVKKAEVARKIMRSARWIYALAKEFEGKAPKDLPCNWLELITYLQKLTYSVDSPELIAYAATTEAYFNDAESVGLKAFQVDKDDESDDPSDSFTSHYLFSDRMLAPSEIRDAFLAGKSPDQIMEFPHVRSLLFKIYHRK